MDNLFSIDTLLEQMVAHNASDLHITVGSKPALRVRGSLARLEGYPDLTAEATRELLYRIISSEQQKRLEIERQLDLGHDATSFADALRGALRQDPDVILLGEMRDLETIATALTAAETGHLVFATLHTQDASSTVDRVIDVFPAAQQGQIRTQLAGTLEGVVAQTLLPTADGQGRVAAVEVLYPDDAVRNLIRQAKIEQVYSVIQTGGKKGLQTMEQALAELVLRGIITEEVAVARSSRTEQLMGLLGRTSVEGGIADPKFRVAGGQAVVDWKKDIKLSHLVRRKKDAEP